MRNRRNTKKRKQQRLRSRTRRIHRQRGGSVLNAPNGSVVIVRDKGDKYSSFVAIDKQEAEAADF
jgi:hypothetical protein